MIGDDIEVTVIAIRGDKVRLGICAPKDVAVHRKEIWREIQEEKRATAGGTGGPDVVAGGSVGDGGAGGGAVDPVRQRQD